MTPWNFFSSELQPVVLIDPATRIKQSPLTRFILWLFWPVLAAFAMRLLEFIFDELPKRATSDEEIKSAVESFCTRSGGMRK